MKRTISRIVAVGILVTIVAGGVSAGRAEQTAPAPDVMSALVRR